MTEKKSFWKSIPDVLKYIAGILGGLAAIIYALQQIGILNQSNIIPPNIISFEVAQSTINLGQSTKLVWVVNDADNITLNGNDVESSGSKTVTPQTTTTYILTANNKNGSKAQKLTVDVVKSSAPSEDEKLAALTRRALDNPKKNAWQGEIVIFNPESDMNLARGQLNFGPTSYKDKIAYANISFDNSTISGLSGKIKATDSCWGFMGASVDNSISLIFSQTVNEPLFVFNKVTKDYTNAYLELRGVLMMKQQGKHSNFAHIRASCRAR